MEFNFLNLRVKIDKPMQQTEEIKSFAKKGIDILTKYKGSKGGIEVKILENEKWYKSQHWEMIRAKGGNPNDPEPITPMLFNTLANKHADAMDNFPKPNMLPKEEDDIEEAKKLSTIVPIILSSFREVYSNAWWTKLKQGWAVYGTFWNKDLEYGYGNIDVKEINPLKIFWEAGITNIQASANVFITDLVDDEILKADFPMYAEYFNGSKPVGIEAYVTDETVDITGKSLVVDWYYKKRENGQTKLHMAKLVNGICLFSSEFDETNGSEYGEYGFYKHGKYPIEFDVLYPEEGSIIGFGYIDLIKSPQIYIDKLDQIISKNALQSGKKRFFIRKGSGMNAADFCDFSKDVVEVEGSLSDEYYRESQAAPLHQFIIQHRMEKINELKDVSAVNEFNRGEGGKGVTAAQAIAMLQEAGNKLSRDMINESYSHYTRIVELIVELIRQFYTEARPFRVKDEDGKDKYIKYSNENMQDKELPVSYEGEDQDENYEPRYRRVCFDIEIVPERRSPFSQAAHNELAKELKGLGFFVPAPEAALQALAALEMMEFEGKAKIVDIINKNVGIQEKLMMVDQLVAENMKMKAIIQKITGHDLGMGDATTPQGPGGMMTNGANQPM